MTFWRLKLAPVMLCALVALLLPATSAFSQTFIIKDGKPNAQIVIAPDQPRKTRLATQELQAYLEKITGAKLPVTTQPDASIPVTIYVGLSEHTHKLGLKVDDLKHDAYRMASGDKWLALIGPEADFVPPQNAPWATGNFDKERARVNREWDALTGDVFASPYTQLFRMHYPRLDLWRYDGAGTLNAVHAFLHDLGVRWYMPGEIGQVVPAAKDIAMPSVNKTVEPDFAVRKLSYFYDHIHMSDDEVLWQFRMGINEGQEIIGLTQPAHGAKFVHLRKEFREKHPNIFATWGGKSAIDHSHSGAPCLSSETFRAKHLEYIDQVFKHYSEPSINLDMPDGYGYLCECDRCKKYAGQGKKWKAFLSDYVYDYVNSVAKEVYLKHPDKTVTALAYSAYQEPPTTIDQLSPNLGVVFCQMRSTFDSREIRDNHRRLRDAWLAKLPSKQLILWEYYLESWPGRRPYEGMPTYYMNIIDEDLKSLKGKTLGDMIEVYRHREPEEMSWNAHAISHLNVYVTTRLWWDADLDMQALLDEYYTLFYGPAREEMKAFIEYNQENWRSMRTDVTVIDKSLDLLSKAKAKAGDGIYGQRVDLLVQYTQPLHQLKERLAKGRKDNPSMRALERREEDFKLDGKIDEKFWNGTRTMDMRELTTGREVDNATKAWFAWAGDSLYVGIRCEDRDMNSLDLSPLPNEDPGMFRRDHIEILLETQVQSYYQLCVSPTGAMFDLVHDVTRMSEWSSGMESKVHRGDGYWSVEIRIPAAGDQAKDLNMLAGVAGRKPTTTYPWFINVCRQRNRGDRVEYSAICPTGTTNFHNIDKFAKLYVND